MQLTSQLHLLVLYMARNHGWAGLQPQATQRGHASPVLLVRGPRPAAWVLPRQGSPPVCASIREGLDMACGQGAAAERGCVSACKAVVTVGNPPLVAVCNACPGQVHC